MIKVKFKDEYHKRSVLYRGEREYDATHVSISKNGFFQLLKDSGTVVFIDPQIVETIEFL